MFTVQKSFAMCVLGLKARMHEDYINHESMRKAVDN